MTYYGGKGSSGSYQHIISEIPLHDVYIEPFLGSGAVFRNKRPAEKSFLLDLDMEIIVGFEDWTGCTLPENTVLMRSDALEFLRYYPYVRSEFVYLDPPYLFSSRSDPRPSYKFELGTDKEHKFLLDIVKKVPCPVAISHYAAALYFSMLDDWRVISWWARTRRGMAEEYLFMNYPVPAFLHDGRYVGQNFTQRQRLRRKMGIEPARV
ncbi:MAG: DNA adenine methylase [Chloroflexi bacterium]|nr:DNA adenine methylase [Chloroflexota bacterium]